MTLVKLDNGDYINTEFVTHLGHRHGALKLDPDHSETLSMANREDEDWIAITPADRDSIVEAMTENNEVDCEDDWTTGAVLVGDGEKARQIWMKHGKYVGEYRLEFLQ